MMDYYNRVQGFINYNYLIQEILVDGVLYVHAKDAKIKFSRSRCYNDASFTKRIHEENMCWYAHGEPYVPPDTMVHGRKDG
jgi:hypothetical protein